MRRSAATRGDIFPGLDHLHKEVRGRMQLQGRIPLQERIQIQNAAHHRNFFAGCHRPVTFSSHRAVLLASQDACKCRVDLLIWGCVEQTAAHNAILSENE